MLDTYTRVCRALVKQWRQIEFTNLPPEDDFRPLIEAGIEDELTDLQIALAMEYEFGVDFYDHNQDVDTEVQMPHTIAELVHLADETTGIGTSARCTFRHDEQ